MFDLSVKNFILICDLAIVSFLIYRVLQIIKGTRAVQMLTGLALIIILYFLAKSFGLTTLEWLLGNFLSSIILVIIVIFQEEIRRGLTKVGINSLFFGTSKKYSEKIIEDIAKTVDILSKEKTGALIVIQKEIGLEEFIEEAVTLDSNFNKKLLISIFNKQSPLHDGAVVIDNERIKVAGCVLPLSFDPDMDPNLGTRHRAALGLSERSDAIIIVVSEETGSVSLVHEATIYRNLDLAGLQDQIDFILNYKKDEKDKELTKDS